MQTRTEALLASVPHSTRIIEIGPGFNPIAPKSDGWNSVSVDHLTREGLIEKYRAHPGVDLGRIEPVDFVWTGGALSDAVPLEQHGKFEIFLASHVIEHTPDLIAFLDSAATLLKQQGVVILVIPDKRYCFDYFQPLTTTGKLLEAHSETRTRHTAGKAFDHFAYAATDGGFEAWGQHPSQGIRLIHKLEHSLQAFRAFHNDASYNDLHAWCFVPSSFELLMLEIARLGETDWSVERVTPTEGPEFTVWLRRGAGAHFGSLSAEEIDARRLTLLKRTLLEAQAQIDWLLAAEPELTRPTGELPGYRVSAAPLDPFAALARSQSESAALRDRLIAAEAQYAIALRRVAAVERSTSWRVTAPLRAAARRARRMLRQGGEIQPLARV